MIEAIVLSNKVLETTKQWQQAIDATGYGIELNTAIPFESLDGFLPVRWKKNPLDRGTHKSGFICRHTSKDQALLDEAFQTPTEEYTNAFILGWGEDPFAKMTLRIAAAAYALATDGIILLRNKPPSRPEDTLANLGIDNEYEWLPRRDISAETRISTSDGDLYRYDERPKTIIRNTGTTKLHQLKHANYAVLVGKNNSGKSFVLKALTEHWGKSASYLGPARYQNFNLLTHYTPTEKKQQEKWNQFRNSWADESQNLDNSPLNLQQAIAELTNDQRSDLKFLVKELLGVELDIRFTVQNSDMSQKYVSCNGHNISFTSSGFRLIITILTSLLDNSYDTILVDEPELGISPEAQGVLADFFFNKKLRKRFFPHIKTLILATHSTVFLDRQNIRNNYTIDKSDDAITIRQIENQKDFNSIHFFLLGNRFETLYLPSAILLVEGKSDRMFIERFLSIRYPSSAFSVIAANTDGQIKHYLHITKGLLNGIQRSPYHDRIFVILDSQHSASLPADVVAMGVPKESVVAWRMNGIEHVYPQDILAEIFGEGPEIAIEGDLISRNGITLNKGDLAERVCQLMRPETKMNSEFQEKLLDKLDAILG